MSWIVAAPYLVQAGVNVVKSVRRDRNQRRPSKNARPSGHRERPEFKTSQREAMREIALMVMSADLSPLLSEARTALIMGLWVNAWHESRLDPRATNDRGEASVGLFQINQKAHPGHRRRNLQRADYNTYVVLELIERQSRRFDELLKSGATIEMLTAAITLWVERPKDPKKKALERARTLRAWFPDLADQQAVGFGRDARRS